MDGTEVGQGAGDAVVIGGVAHVPTGLNSLFHAGGDQVVVGTRV